jgi:hypothetical protein
LFTAAWTAVLIFLARVFLWQTVYELRLDGGTLYWRAPLRSGAAQLSEVRELRPKRFTQNAELIRLTDGSSLMVLMMKGFLPFVNDIAREAPDLPVKVSPFFSRLSEKWPLQGDGGYRRGP